MVGENVNQSETRGRDCGSKILDGVPYRNGVYISARPQYVAESHLIVTDSHYGIGPSIGRTPIPSKRRMECQNP